MNSLKQRGTLILCVDRDNDVGVKGGLKTPIIGRDEVMNAALKLILADSEEPDANAMFEAVKIYEDLSKEGPCEVAVIAGSMEGGIKSTKKILAELKEVLDRFPTEKAILVSDGFSDEEVIPIIRYRIPVLSVRRVIVRHSETIEELGAIFIRYMKRLTEDPHYSKLMLGVPGLLMIIFSLLWFFNLLRYASLVTLLIIGGFLFMKGFRIDEKVSQIVVRMREKIAVPHELLRIFANVVGVMIIIIACYRGLAYLSSSYVVKSIEEFLVILPLLISDFIQQSLQLLILGACISLIGSSIYYYLLRDERIFRSLSGILLLIVSFPITMEVSYILKNPTHQIQPLLIWTGIGITILLLLFIIHQLREGKLRKGQLKVSM